MMLLTLTILRNRLKKDYKFKEWLEHTYSFSDKMIILDNNSDDGTLEFVEKFNDSQNKIVLIDKVDLDFATQESLIRAMAWEGVRKYAKEGDYVLVVDSDEFIETNFIQNKKQVLEYMDRKNLTTGIFKFCDMWSENRYRIDGLWSPCFPRLFKYENKDWGPVGTGLHLSNIPSYALRTNQSELLPYRMLHYSYHTKEIRQEKYDYYMNRSTGDNLEHAKTILNNPLLKEIIPLTSPKIMIASLIRNREWILPEFLKSLENINYPKAKIGFYFIINNSTDKSMSILDEWAKKNEKKYPFIIIDELNFERAGEDKERNWVPDVIFNMAYMRNMHLKKLQIQDCDYLFSIDSDLLLQPSVLINTLLMDKLVCSPVFFARWNSKDDKGQALPQCWINGPYHVTQEWIDFLKTHKSRIRCGGLGALTLIDKSITRYPQVNYDLVYTLGNAFWGEDRWFCNRCSVFGIDLWAHTYNESRHADNKEDLKGHLDYVEKNKWWSEESLLHDLK